MFVVRGVQTLIKRFLNKQALFGFGVITSMI